MIDRCYWIRDEDGFEVFIPHCWGGLYGPEGCTCDVEASRLEKAERRRDVAEAEVLRLREKLHSAADLYEDETRRVQRLYAEIRALRARLLAFPLN